MAKFVKVLVAYIVISFLTSSPSQGEEISSQCKYSTGATVCVETVVDNMGIRRYVVTDRHWIMTQRWEGNYRYHETLVFDRRSNQMTVYSLKKHLIDEAGNTLGKITHCTVVNSDYHCGGNLLRN